MKMQSFPQPCWPDKDRDDVTPGLCLLSALTASELGEALSPSQARGFYLAIGKRFAALEPLEGVTDLAVLSTRTNTFWRTLGWGSVEIEAGAQAIAVRHHHAPLAIPGGNPKHWRPALQALLEGAYDAWFRALGSGPALTTVSEWKGDVLELRHGR
ncbi:hypothetical protein [Novosphingobium sp. PP1Y]|uniref:cellulose biosynthesis protein BcsD n=1 Tax=Novosphingobium sp. PP1Y TaxID=702113 RepID=UPI0002DFE765|nr:hypothetical protein [Novosphingobium sp. PP1Y]